MSTEKDGGERMPCFFKVFMPGFSQKMRIPKKFSSQYLANDDYRMVSISSPLKKVFCIGLERDGEDIYFSNGWQEFLQEHKVSIGYFLVFHYHRNLSFTVKVYDVTSCFLDYSKTLPAFGKQAKVSTGNPDNGNVSPFLDENVSNKNKNANRVADTRHKTPDLSASCKVEEVESPLTNHQLPGSRSFTKTIRLYSINYKKIALPLRICRSCGLTRKKQITLIDSERRSWNVNFVPRAKEAHLIDGWREFSEAHKLQVGDQCIFTIVSSEVMHIQVQKLHK